MKLLQNEIYIFIFDVLHCPISSSAHEKLTLASRVFESLFQKTFLLVQHITVTNNLCEDTLRLPV